MGSARWSRLRLARELTYRLRDKKARTGITPNILCRLGFCLSLADEQIPDPASYDEEGLEFNRSTLVGEWDEMLELLLRQRIADDGLDPEIHYLPQLRAHMNRGAEIICNRVRSIGDIAAFIPSGHLDRSITDVRGGPDVNH